MRHLNEFILALILALSPAASIGQKTQEVKENASSKAESRLDNKIDEGLDKGLNAVEGLFKKKNKTSGNSSEASKAASDKDHPTVETIKSSSAVPTSNTSADEEVSTVDAALFGDFTGSMSMSIHSTKKGKDQGTTVFNYYFSENLWAMETSEDGQATRMIMDYGAERMTTLMEDKKGDRTGVKMKMPKWNQVMDDESVTDTQDELGLDFKKTGKTKTINGKLCHEYIGNSDDGKFVAWIDESQDFNMTDVFSGFARKAKKESWQNTPYKGLLMESIWTSEDGKEVVTMKTLNFTEGSVDQSKFSTSGYEVMDMSSLPGFGQ